MNFKKISTSDNDMLIGRFGDEEVKEAIWSCGSSKSLGPDGFHFKFTKDFWETLKGDICNFLNDFYEYDTFPGGVNALFISLIPKISDPQVWGDYRPISLVDCMYKGWQSSG